MPDDYDGTKRARLTVNQAAVDRLLRSEVELVVGRRHSRMAHHAGVAFLDRRHDDANAVLSEFAGPIQRLREALDDPVEELERGLHQGSVIGGADVLPCVASPFGEACVSAQHIADARGVQIVGSPEYHAVVQEDVLAIGPRRFRDGANHLAPFPLREPRMDDGAGRQDCGHQD